MSVTQRIGIGRSTLQVDQLTIIANGVPSSLFGRDSEVNQKTRSPRKKVAARSNWNTAKTDETVSQCLYDGRTDTREYSGHG